MCSRLLMEEEEENRQHVYNSSSSSERVGKRRKKKRGQKSPCCVWKEKEKRKQLLERERREGGRCRVAIGSFSSGCDPCRRLFLFLSDDFLWVYRWCSYNFHHTCRQSSPALPQQQQHKTSSEITKERERERERPILLRASLSSINPLSERNHLEITYRSCRNRPVSTVQLSLIPYIFAYYAHHL